MGIRLYPCLSHDTPPGPLQAYGKPSCSIEIAMKRPRQLTPSPDAVDQAPVPVRLLDTAPRTTSLSRRT